MILLNDLLHFTDEQAENAKVKFNIYDGETNPIELFKSNPDKINKSWLYWRNDKRYFRVGQIAICLVRISGDHWLLTTIDRVDRDLDVKVGVFYEGTPLAEYMQYFGRTIIRFHKKAQNQGLNFKTIANQLEVCQILSDTFDDDDFPGYDNVRLTYQQLKNILERCKKDWIAALETQKAVYLITDTNTGKLYVGSATSNNGMLLQRWSNYIRNGHSGNKELKKIVEERGFEYVKDYFQYAILENYNSKIDDKIILSRESWWKETLRTCEFGYNDN